MNLAVDIGNSRLKWGLVEAGRIISGFPLINHHVDRQALMNTWKSISPPQRIAISCVSAEKLSDLVRIVALELWPKAEIIHVNSIAQGFGVTNAYQNPEKLGVDRWLSLVAVRNRYASPACIADCGTAITLDMINDKGEHLGGMICPGLTLMRQSLSAGTESLPFTSKRYDVGPANFTEAAIYSGALMAAAGLIERVFAGQPEHSLLILTGGDAPVVAAELRCKTIVDADLVLQGLAIILEESI